MTVQKIALFSLLGAGAVGGSVTGIYHFSKDKIIEDSLIRKGAELINNDDEYGATFLKWKNNEGFKTTIGNIQETTNFQQGSLALKNWCETNLKLELTNKETENKLPKVKEYCSKQTLNIEARLAKSGKILVANDRWVAKYGTVKGKQPSDGELAKDLKIEGITDDTNNTKAGVALQTWCNENIKTKLVEDKEEKTWKKVEERCAK